MCEKKKAFTIYKISGNGFTYVGMTTQALSTRFRQHKLDAMLHPRNWNKLRI